jgi:hypothetical protein
MGRSATASWKAAQCSLFVGDSPIERGRSVDYLLGGGADDGKLLGGFLGLPRCSRPARALATQPYLTRQVGRGLRGGVERIWHDLRSNGMRPTNRCEHSHCKWVSLWRTRPRTLLAPASYHSGVSVACGSVAPNRLSVHAGHAGHVGSTSSCPVLLASEMSGLQRKVHLRRKPAGGCTRGAAAPLLRNSRGEPFNSASYAAGFSSMGTSL